MNCLRCGSEDLFQFEVGQAPSPPKAADLPCVCRGCNAIMVSGEVVDLPEVLAKPILDLAEGSKAYGAKAREELEELAKADPEARVEGYMSNFYRAAYMDGFFRALMFFRHNSREGRLIRLRELWKKVTMSGRAEGRIVCFEMDRVSYNEFEQLLHLSAIPGESNAKSHSHKHPSRSKHRPSVP
jgi:hypothetical protein